MLRQVFNALDRAERECGLFHADLGMRNVMETYPELYPEPQAEQTRKNVAAEHGGPSEQQPLGDDAGPRYEITTGALPTQPDTPASVAQTVPTNTNSIAKSASGNNISRNRTRASGGNVVVSGDRVDAERIPTAVADLNLSVHASVPALNEMPGGGDGSGAAAPTSAAFRVRPRPGYTCNGDGSRMPLGPRVEFKIIDYGSSFFSETLAQTTGGFRARHNYYRLTRLFETGKVAFRSPTRKTLVELDTSAGKVNVMPGKPEKRRHILPTTRIKNRVSFYLFFQTRSIFRSF
jgi:hypothetical protein